MPRSTEQNEVLRSVRRSIVETAAVRVFARSGFAAASMRQIAAEASISTGSIYRHYASKEELFDGLLKQASNGLEVAVTQLSANGDPITLIRSFTETYLADLTAGEGAAEFYMVINQAITTDVPAGAASRLAVIQARLWRAFAALVRRGQEEGQIATGSPEHMTAHYFAMLAGVMTMHSAMKGQALAPDTELILRIFAGGPR